MTIANIRIGVSRHCDRRVAGAPFHEPVVIANEVKQSRTPESMDCRAALAVTPTDDARTRTTQHLAPVIAIAASLALLAMTNTTWQSMAVEPVVYGASERPPRGDYSRAGADYTCAQNYAQYTEADHDTYRRLYERQSALLPGLACDEFIAALPSLGVKDRIPRFEEINERLRAATGWEIVAVPGLIPEVPFFTLLANRKFPVTDWIRTPAGV